VKETADMNLLDLNDKYAAVVYIWKSKDICFLRRHFVLLLIFSS
jgi:hypothetical protein